MERRRGGDPDRDGLQPKPAPGPLALVQSFVNTRNVMRGYDLLEDIGGAAGWLAERGLLDGDVQLSGEDRDRLPGVWEGGGGLVVAPKRGGVGGGGGGG